MHRGTAFIITKNEQNEFEIYKSTEFNGGMGLDLYGKKLFEMLKKLDDFTKFDELIRKFDNKHFEYNDDVMTYKAFEKSKPYIYEKGIDFDYYQHGKQFDFFKDDKCDYIYTSDSNYIKNMTDTDVCIVCCNGTYKLQPNQILVSDYNECINNSKESFGHKIDKDICIEKLDTAEYKMSKKEKFILDKIVETIESFGFKTHIVSENNMNNGLEIEAWTDDGVDMIQTIVFYEQYYDLYNIENINQKLEMIYNDFSIDDEIDFYRQDKTYKERFTIKDSIIDFEKYEQKLKDLSEGFLNKYNELILNEAVENEEEGELET